MHPSRVCSRLSPFPVWEHLSFLGPWGRCSLRVCNRSDPFQYYPFFQWIANGQTGHQGDHVLKAVMGEAKDLPDRNWYLKEMAVLALAQVKNLSLAILKDAPVSL